MPTRRPGPSCRAAAALVLVFALGACTKGGQFDPTEMLDTDFLNTKKKIQGEREPLFPQGVPGAETGVPPDLVKGYQPPPEPAAVAPDASAAAKTAAAAEKPKPKPKPKPKVATTPPPAAHDPAFDQKPISPGQAQQPAQAWPAPQPSQPAQAPWPAPGQAQTNWPAPPPASTH
jgi:hypothetical protein